MDNDSSFEGRPEPKVEVSNLEDLNSPATPEKPLRTTWMENRPAKKKKWIFGPLILVVIAGLSYGLWTVFKSDYSPFKKSQESSEIKTLKEGLQKMDTERAGLKKEVQALQGEQKLISEEIKTLKNQLAVLARKMETPPIKKQSPKSISYKVKKGDSLSSIAKKYRVNQEEVRRWNHLSPKSNPRPGQTLVIHTPSS